MNEELRKILENQAGIGKDCKSRIPILHKKTERIRRCKMGRIKSLLLILLILGSISLREMECEEESEYSWDYFDFDDDCED